MGTTKGNTTDDLQGSRQIDHQLRLTCLGVQTYMTPTTEKSNTHRTRLWESLLDVTRCLVSIIYTPKQKCWKLRNTQSYCLHSTWPDAWNQEMYVIPSQQRATPESQMKETLYTRHRNTVEPMMVNNDRKATLQALHTVAVVKAVQCHERNVVLDGRPPPINNSENELTRKECSTLAQLRSRHCRLLDSYKSRIKKDASLDVCADWHDASWCQASLRLPGSPDYTDTVRPMEQTDGRCPGTELSRGERPRLKWTWAEKRTTTSAQYLARCLEPENVCHSMTTMVTPKRQMKETLFTRNCNTVELMMIAKNRKVTLQALHTDAVNKAVKCHERNVVLDGLPLPISNSKRKT